MMHHHRIGIACYLVVFVLLCDQFTKWWVVKNVLSAPSYYPVAPYINFVLVWNKGVTFGLLNRIDHHFMPYLLVLMALVVLVILGRWLFRSHSLLVVLALAAIIGGALGNIIDRVRYGAVVDFIDIYYQNYHWYTFNLADAAIVCGVSLLMMDSLVRGK